MRKQVYLIRDDEDEKCHHEWIGVRSNYHGSVYIFCSCPSLSQALTRLDGLTIFGRSLSVSQVRWNVTP